MQMQTFGVCHDDKPIPTVDMPVFVVQQSLNSKKRRCSPKLSLVILDHGLKSCTLDHEPLREQLKDCWF